MTHHARFPVPLLLAAAALLLVPAPAHAQQAAPPRPSARRASAKKAKTHSPAPAAQNPSGSLQRLTPPQPVAPAPPPIVPGAVQLDHVVASIGSNVILESDVAEEMRFSALEPLRVLPGQNTPDRALRRLIDRTLILQQMKEQQLSTTTRAAVVDQAIERLRKEIPACARFHCNTQQGWQSFLNANGLTLKMVQERWSQRIAILRFIDIRFRAGIRISQEQIDSYYNKVLLPALAKRHDPTPPLSNVSSRIREVLLQQQVSGLFQDWLSSLRDQGNVRIVDPRYFALDATLKSGDRRETDTP